MRRARRQDPEVSISFLDVITCGFGAIILLLMIAKVGEAVPAAIVATPGGDDGRAITQRQEQLFALRGEARLLQRQVESRREQIAAADERTATLDRTLKDRAAGQAAAAADAQAGAALEAQLLAAKQSLDAEMKRLLSRRTRARTDLVGGVPVDSEYIIFVIDTSGSMFQYAWDRMLRTMVEILNVYPNVKGMQVMNDEGQYMFANYRGQWIPDTPARRRAVLERLQGWNAYSNSSPVEGIEEAIRTFYSPDKRISIYVFGDDFSPGLSISQVIDVIDTLNRRTDGQPRVRIHGVGFPVLFENPPPYDIGGRRFAALMRELARRNGGTFVALDDYR